MRSGGGRGAVLVRGEGGVDGAVGRGCRPPPRGRDGRSRRSGPTPPGARPARGTRTSTPSWAPAACRGPPSSGLPGRPAGRCRARGRRPPISAVRLSISARVAGLLRQAPRGRRARQLAPARVQIIATFCHSSRSMSFGTGHSMPASRAGFPQGDDARALGVVHLADPEDLQPVEVADDARSLDERADVRDATEHALRPEHPAKDSRGGQCRSAGGRRRSRPRGRGGPPRPPSSQSYVLTVKRMQSAGAESARVVARPHGPELDVAELAPDREAVRAQRFEMPAARDEADFVPGRGEAGAEVPPDAPRPHHRELHGPISCSARNHLRVQRLCATDQSVPDWKRWWKTGSNSRAETISDLGMTTRKSPTLSPNAP